MTKRHSCQPARAYQAHKTDCGAKAPGDPEPNIRIGIGRRIVQIQRKRPGIAAIVPIATADEAVIIYPYPKHVHCAPSWRLAL